MENTKAYWRQKMRERRAQLTPAEQQAAIDELEKQAASILPQTATYCLSYKPIIAANEVPVDWLEKMLVAAFPQLLIYYPRLAPAHNLQVVLPDGAGFGINQWNILEPLGQQLLSPSKIDIILVPLLAFDTNGHRVGYGKGYYDRLLAKCRPDLVSIGVSWFGPVPPIADINSNDLPLKYCLTPQHTYAF